MATDVGFEIILDFNEEHPFLFAGGVFNENNIPEDLKKYIEEHILDDFIAQFGGVIVQNYTVNVDVNNIKIKISGTISVPAEITMDDMRTYMESIFDLSSNASDFIGSVNFNAITNIGGRFKMSKNKRGKSTRKSKRKSKRKSTRKKR